MYMWWGYYSTIIMMIIMVGYDGYDYEYGLSCLFNINDGI